MKRPEEHIINSIVFYAAEDVRKYAEDNGIIIYSVWRQHMKHHWYTIYRTAPGGGPSVQQNYENKQREKALKNIKNVKC
jgi:hypothetical protein